MRDYKITFTVNSVTKSLNKKPILSGVSFSAHSGEVLALLGPNGAGKTTTLRVAAGLLLPDSGSTTITNAGGHTTQTQGKVAYMPEMPDFYPALTIGEHIRFVALLYGMENWQPRADELLERFQLSDRIDALPDELSQGMRRKLGLIMALLHGSQIVLLDEPFNGLDPRAVHELRELITSLAKSGVAVVVSTHRLEETEKLADRLVIMDKGRVVKEGTVEQLRETSGLKGGADLEKIFLELTKD